MRAAPRAFFVLLEILQVGILGWLFPKKYLGKKCLTMRKGQWVSLLKVPSCFSSWEPVGSSSEGGVLEGQDMGIQLLSDPPSSRDPSCPPALPRWTFAQVITVTEAWGRANQHEVFSCVIAQLSHNLDKALSPTLITYKLCYEMRPWASGLAPKVTLQFLFASKNRCW